MSRVAALLCRSLLLLVLAGLVSPMTTRAAPAIPADVPSRFVTGVATGLTVTPNLLYYHTSCGGDFYPSLSFLRRTRIDRSSVETRYAPATCAAGAVASANVAVDSTDVYWIEPDGRIVRQATAGSDLATTLFAQTSLPSIAGYPSCCWITVDSINVYWNEGRAVYKKAKSGGEPQLIFTETVGSIHDLHAGGDGTILYLANGQLRLLRPSGSSYAVSTVASNVAAYALAANRIYFGISDSADFYLINSVRASDLGDFQNHYVSDRVGRPRLSDLVADSTNLYWHDQRGATAGGPIWRKPLAGDLPAVQLTSYRSDVHQLQLAGARLFWTDYNTGIWTVPTGASVVAPPSGDLEITELHVTQGIQTDDNRIPWVGDKTTIVRVFVRGLADSNGPWADVVARMQVEGDATHYDLGPIALPTGSSDRYGLADSFTFVLSHAATAPGSRTIRVTIGALSGRPEATTTNNSATMALTFGPAQHIVWFGLTYGNINTTCVGPYAPDGVIPAFSRFEPHRKFTENILPVSSLTILPVPGDPQRLFDNSGTCTAYETAHTYLAHYMARMFPSGGRRAFLLTPESTGYYGWCCTSDAGNQVARGQDLIPDPGPTTAHEMAHSYGGVHTFEDSHYPRPNGSMGNYLGFRLFSNESTPRPQIIRGETDASTFYGDLMSYSPPLWISPYTYCLLSNSISGGANRCPPGLDGIPSAANVQKDAQGMSGALAQTYLYVSGYLDDKDQMVLLPFEQAELTGIPTGPKGTAYQLTLETIKGGVLPNGTYPFDVAPAMVDGVNNPQPRTERSFGFYIPWNPLTEAIRISANGKTVTERLVSPSSPKFTALDFKPAGSVQGVQKVGWTANDQDGDPLTYSVWYSANGGKQWLPVDVDEQANTTSVNFDLLPGSQQAQLRVLASDGVNTAAIVGAPFGVALHPPIVSATASLDVAGNLVLASGTAYDAEDGAINDPGAFRWTSNWQGSVGDGQWLSAASLAPGPHTLTLAVTDHDGTVGTTTLDVVVPGRPDESAEIIDPASAHTLWLAGSPGVTATFAAGTVNAVVRITASHMVSPSISLPGLIGLPFEIDAQALDGSSVTKFAQPFTLAATYDEQLLNGAAEQQLALFFEDDKTGYWKRIDSAVDMQNNRITAQVDHLTRFAVVARPPDGSSSSTSLYLPAVTR